MISYLLFAVIFRKGKLQRFRKTFLLSENVNICLEMRNIVCKTSFLFEVASIQQKAYNAIFVSEIDQR